MCYISLVNREVRPSILLHTTVQFIMFLDIDSCLEQCLKIY